MATPAPALNEDQYTDAQLSDGTTLRFKGQLQPEEVKQKVAAYRQKQGKPLQATPEAIAKNAQPTEFEKQNTPGFFGKAAEVARRFTQGAGLPQSTEASDYNPYHGLKQILTHPINSAKLFGEAMLSAQKSRFEKAREVEQETEKTPGLENAPGFFKKALAYSKAAPYALQGATPILGPAMGSIEDSAEQAIKDKSGWEGAGALAEGAGLAATLGLAKAPKEVGGESFLNKAVQSARGTKLAPAEASSVRPEGAFQPPLANAPEEVLQHASQEGINLTPFQASETKLAGKLQGAGEHGIVGGQTLETAMNAERAKFGEAVNKMTERVDSKRMGLSEEAAGEAIKQSTETAKSIAHENAAQGYKKIDYLMNEKVDPAPISKKWMDLRESLPMGVEDQIRAQVPRNLRAAVEDMLSARPEGFEPTFEQAIKLRSFFREMGETEGLPNSHQAAFRQLSQAADSAMESTAKKVGSEAEWREANQGWKDYTGKYGDKQSPLYKILKQNDPAKVTRDLMNRASAADIETLRNEGMTSALEPLRRQVIQDIARNKFRVGRDGLGGYSDSFLHQLFGPGGKKELYLKADLARRMNWDPNPSGSGGQLLVGEQLSKPSKIAQLFGAAKMSMPRPAQSFLPETTPSRYSISPGLASAALLQMRRGQ